MGGVVLLKTLSFTAEDAGEPQRKSRPILTSLRTSAFPAVQSPVNPLFAGFAFLCGFAINGEDIDLRYVLPSPKSDDSHSQKYLPLTSYCVFRFGHAQVGNCMPSRKVLWSGRYPHNNHVEGFYEVKNPGYR